MKEFVPQEQWERYSNEYIPYHLDKLKSDKSLDVVSGLGGLSSGHKILSVLEWHLHKDAEKFREYMKEAIRYFLEWVKQDETVIFYPPSLVQLLDVLNTGNVSLIKEFIEYVDDHFDYKTKPDAHPADWLYRCLVALVLGRNADQWEFFIEKLKKGYSVQKRLKLYPYALLLEAIWTKNETLFHEQLQIIAETHKKLTRSIFDDYEDKLLCLWGIALCNLAKMKGLRIEFDHPFIPKELI